ncbi:hypothetical protein P2318_11215 [Myxococcaceae bacterium GXIMD 01537]
MSAKKGSLESLRVRVRRFQFILGLGFFALMLGSVLSGSLVMRLSHRLQALPGNALRTLVGVVLEELWVLLALPLLCYAAARVVELNPLSTGLGAALSGQTFVVALQFVRDGEPWASGGWRVDLLRFVAFAVGIALSVRAVKQARAANQQREDSTRAQAAGRKEEYDAFLRDAERAGERTAQREAQAAAASAPAPAPEAAAPAPVAAPASEAAAPADAAAPAVAPVVSLPIEPSAETSDSAPPKASGS